MTRCKIKASNCKEKRCVSSCENYDKDTSIEIRLYDYKTDKFMYKTITETELEMIDKVLGNSWRIKKQ